jgi:NAD(P)-dependent dehydrogenase (short-subunit alcohol dehydrogenase family)
VETGLSAGTEGIQLQSLYRSCYICKCRFQTLHPFYDQLCFGVPRSCAELNMTKRNMLPNLQGRVALVTGARVKIGFHIALRLLRSGCSVVATSRFPHDTAERFAAQPDFAAWGGRLHVYGLDLRDMGSLEAFCALLNAQYERLDLLVHNACQTVRRPPSYYAPVIPKETRPLAALSDAVRPLVERNHAFRAAGGGGASFRLAAGDAASTRPLLLADAAAAAAGPMPAATLASAPGLDSAADVGAAAPGSVSALQSQLALVPGDELHDAALFPAGAVDVNGQQLDLRRVNSWVLRMDQVSTPELAEVMAINAMAPFVMNARLKPLMLKGQHVPEPLPRVSAVSEGVLTRGAWAAHELEEEAAEAQRKQREEQLQHAIETNAANRAKKDFREIKRERERRRADAAADPLAKKKDRNAGSKILGQLSPPLPLSYCRFIVNVSAMEGKFTRVKSPFHTHTNMAKAALNMMTRTSAADYADQGIFMNSVDTGWINPEVPVHDAVRIAQENNFQTPLDEIDAAMRVLDPMFGPYVEAQAAQAAGATGEPMARCMFGAFLKDYFPTEW